MAQTIDSGRGGTKYALLTEQMYKTLKNMNQNVEQTQSEEFARAKRLENKIQEVLADKSLSPADKARLYSLAASEFVDVRKRAPETQMFTTEQEIAPPPPPAPLPPAPEPVEQGEDVIFDRGDNIFDQGEPPQVQQEMYEQLMEMPKSRRDKAKVILQEIEEEGNIVDFDPFTDEIIIGGVPMENSNFFKMLDHVTNPKPPKSKAKKLEGTSRFLKALGRAGVDPNLIPNNILRHFVEQGRQEGMGVVNKWVRFY